MTTGSRHFAREAARRAQPHIQAISAAHTEVARAFERGMAALRALELARIRRKIVLRERLEWQRAARLWGCK